MGWGTYTVNTCESSYKVFHHRLISIMFSANVKSTCSCGLPLSALSLCIYLPLIILYCRSPLSPCLPLWKSITLWLSLFPSVCHPSFQCYCSCPTAFSSSLILSQTSFSPSHSLFISYTCQKVNKPAFPSLIHLDIHGDFFLWLLLLFKPYFAFSIHLYFFCYWISYLLIYGMILVLTVCFYLTFLKNLFCGIMFKISTL